VPSQFHKLIQVTTNILLYEFMKALTVNSFFIPFLKVQLVKCLVMRFLVVQRLDFVIVTVKLLMDSNVCIWGQDATFGTNLHWAVVMD